MGSLQTLRKQLNLSQRELAQKLNVTQSAVAKWETGEVKPRSDKLLKISSVLDCSVDEILKAVQISA